jgi:hypothetical protein
MNICFNIAILLLTDNCVDKIDKSLESIRSQNFDSKRIKIVFVDNASLDGTYEKLIEYTRTMDLAIYRIREKCLRTRLLQEALSFLDFTDYKYITLLEPGDVLFPDFIKSCTSVMERHATHVRRVLITETERIDASGHSIQQRPLFSESCMLQKRLHYPYLMAHGTDHKVQCFFSKGTIPMVLTELPFFIDHRDLFKTAAFSFSNEWIYLKDVLSRLSVSNCEDPAKDLMLKLYLSIRLDLINGTVFADMPKGEDNNLPSQTMINECLANLALKYAAQAYDKNDHDSAKKLMLFSELVDETILKHKAYQILAQKQKSEGLVQLITGHLVQEITFSPPFGSKRL